MLGIQQRILILTGGIDDFSLVFLVLVFDEFREGVLDCRIVGFDKVRFDELYFFCTVNDGQYRRVRFILPVNDDLPVNES